MSDDDHSQNGGILSLTESAEIQRTRKALAIMLYVSLVSSHHFEDAFLTIVEEQYLWERPPFPVNAKNNAPFQVLCTVGTIRQIKNYKEALQQILQRDSPIFAVIFYSFGLLVAHKYHQTGLLVVCCRLTFLLRIFSC